MTTSEPQGDSDRDPQNKPIASARRRAQELRAGAGPQNMSTGAAREGRMIGTRYRLERRLGQGGMGVVWLARDLPMNESVALKFLPKAFSQDSEALKELHAEARVMRELTHPNIVRLHDIRFFQGRAFLVQAFMAGGSLDDLLCSLPDGCLSVEETMWALREVVPGLSHAHANGITHRDIKPANLLLSKRVDGLLSSNGESLRIADFGLAFSARQSMLRSSGFRPSGTLAFMAPEILLGKRPTPAADVYSLAATVFCMIEGHAPFNSGDIASQILHAPAPALFSGRESLDHAVAAALTKNVDERPATVEEFMRIAEGSIRMDFPLPKKKRRALWPIGVAGGVLALVALVFMTRDRWSPLESEQTTAVDGTGQESNSVHAANLDRANPAAQEVAGPDSALRLPNLSGERQVQKQPEPRSEVELEAARAVEAANASEAALQQEALEKALEEISGATDLASLESLMLADLGSETGSDCDALCAAAVPAARSILERLSAEPTPKFADQLQQLTHIESIAGAIVCGRGAEWTRLAAQIPLPTARFEPDSPPTLESCGDWIEMIAAHALPEHECKRDADLVALALASRNALELALVKGLDRPGPGFLEPLDVLESLGEPFPEPSLPLVRERFGAVAASASLAQDEDWMRAISRHLARQPQSRVAVEADEARERVLKQRLQTMVAEVRDCSKLFEELMRLEKFFDSAQWTTPRGLQGIPGWMEKRTRFKGKNNRLAVVAGIFGHLEERPETVFDEAFQDLLGRGEGELLEWLKKSSKGKKSFKSLKSRIALTTKLYDIGINSSFTSEPTNRLDPGRVYLAVWTAVASEIADLRREAKAQIDKQNLVSLNIGAKNLMALAAALEGSSPFKEEYLDLLPYLGDTLIKRAKDQNLVWRRQLNNKRMFSTKEFREGIQWSKEWLRAARTNSGANYGESRALTVLVDLYVTSAEHYEMHCRRNYSTRGPGDQSEVIAPQQRIKDGLDQLQLAEESMSSGGVSSSFLARINNTRKLLKEMRI